MYKYIYIYIYTYVYIYEYIYIYIYMLTPCARTPPFVAYDKICVLLEPLTI